MRVEKGFDRIKEILKRAIMRKVKSYTLDPHALKYVALCPSGPRAGANQSYRVDAYVKGVKAKMIIAREPQYRLKE